jgi:hypothetical protein
MNLEAARPRTARVDRIVVRVNVAAVETEVVAGEGDVAIGPVRRVGLVGDAQLSEVVLGGVDPGVVPGLADGRQEDAHEQGDDGDDHEQLDDRESLGEVSLHGVYFLLHAP